MFFWGSYNFQVPQLTEHPNRLPLRFPVYVPPTPSMVNTINNNNTSGRNAGGTIDNNNNNNNNNNSDDINDNMIAEQLRRIDSRHIEIKMLACGQKHLLILATTADNTNVLSKQEFTNTETPDSFTSTNAFNNNNSNNNNNNTSVGVGVTSPSHNSSENWILYGMGSNHSGQLGHRVPQYITTLTKLYFEEFLSAGTTITSLACGNKHTLISTSNGSVFAAGDNSCSQLGTSVKVNGFAPVAGLAHIKCVYAAGNASFALDYKGQLYSWGEAQFGHLCHGDNGERLDPRNLQVIKTNVNSPTLVQWFVRHHVIIVEVAVGRSHLVCRSEDEVYTCGDISYGKLGRSNYSSNNNSYYNNNNESNNSNNTEWWLTPTRVRLPERAHPERLCSIAAGDEHTIVLRYSDVVGSVIYHFGRTSNGDSQPTPTIIQAAPTNIIKISAGRGTMSVAITNEGRLHVWGKHGYSRVGLGAAADAVRNELPEVIALESFIVTQAAVGGSFVVAFANSRRNTSMNTINSKEENKDNNNNNNNNNNINQERWDIVIPHDDRISSLNQNVIAPSYEDAVQSFLTQYLGPKLAKAYIANMPIAPPATDPYANIFKPIGAHALTVGKKVRLWMTDVYALGTVIAVITDNKGEEKEEKKNNITEVKKYNNKHIIDADYEEEEEEEEEEEKEDIEINNKEFTQKTGQRLCIEWQRDDWHNEEITLYSEDETLDVQNPNRWQPFWFLQDPNKNNEYLLNR